MVTVLRPRATWWAWARVRDDLYQICTKIGVIIIQLSTSSVCACVRESGRSQEAIRPELKTSLYLESCSWDATSNSPLIRPAMTLKKALHKSRWDRKVGWRQKSWIRESMLCTNALRREAILLYYIYIGSSCERSCNTSNEFLQWVANWTSHMFCQDVHLRDSVWAAPRRNMA